MHLASVRHCSRGVHLWRTHLEQGVPHTKAVKLIIAADRATDCVARGVCTKSRLPLSRLLEVRLGLYRIDEPRPCCWGQEGNAEPEKWAGSLGGRIYFPQETLVPGKHGFSTCSDSMTS